MTTVYTVSFYANMLLSLQVYSIKTRQRKLCYCVKNCFQSAEYNLITKKLIFGFQILDLKVHFSAP